MNVETRYKKLRTFASRVNKARKIQAKKIDILCNDLIAAHRQFIKNLNSFSFAANFYEAILGKTDLQELLNIAGSLITEQIPDSSVVFFLRKSILCSPDSIDTNIESDTFEMYPCTKLLHDDPQNQPLESFVTAELVNNICAANKLCSIEQMLEMGLQISPVMLKKFSAYAIPLTKAATAVGFILIYRCSEPPAAGDAELPVDNASVPKLDKEMLNDISVITAGLSRAISVSVLQNTI